MTDFDVFISFSQHDKATADAACARLEASGVTCWIAPRNIPYGQNWGEGIIEGINRSRLMVLIFSANANESPHVQREVERAVSRGIPVIPFRIENVAPSRGLEYFLSLPNWLDAFTPPLEPYLTALVKAVGDFLQKPQELNPPRVEPPPLPPKPAPPLQDWRFIAAAAAGVLVIGVVAWGLWPSTSGNRNDVAVADDVPGPVPPVPNAPVPTKEVVISFAGINTANVPEYMVAAAPYLHQAPIAISLTEFEPSTSRVVLINNLGLYGGNAVAKTYSETFLTQMNTGNVPAFFTLQFSEPVASVSFVVPRVGAASTSGITFPAWRAQAFSSSGQELASTSLGLVRRFSDVPAQTYTMNAPAFEGISSVRFSSDPQLDGAPFAAFSALLIEQITLTRP